MTSDISQSIDRDYLLRFADNEKSLVPGLEVVWRIHASRCIG